MADRPKGYGMTAELARKNDAKYNETLEIEARNWMERITGEPLCPAQIGCDHFHEALKSGVYLVKLANAMGGHIKVNESKMAFKQMENIGKFLEFCEKMGMAKQDLFQTVDLFEKQNMAQVVTTIHALGRKEGTLGPKEATSNVREFSEEQLRAGQNVIGLQMGSNKGASQAGQNFGKTRAILD